jgi:multimeric flavodoxin WrbA
MKVTTILGSPKKNGNTAKVLNVLEELLAIQGHEVDRIHIVDYEVKGCQGCGACQKVTDKPGCVQKDEAEAVFKRMITSDAVIYASPLYGWDFTSQMKPLLDRHFCLATGFGSPNHISLLEGKRTALLVTCGGPVEKNTDLIQKLFARMNKYTKCHVVGKYVLPFCTTPDVLGDNVTEIAQTMSRDIVGSQ